MADYQVLGLFHEAAPTADTIDKLHQLGVPDDKITIMSGIPYRNEMFGRQRPRGRLLRFALLGAILGVATAAFLTAGIFLLYPINAGGQGIVPVPPSLIIFFEVAMLGTMYATFAGLLVVNRFPRPGPRLYDPRITEGHIGVEIQIDEALVEQAESLLEANGAHHINHMQARPLTNRRLWVFWGTVAALVLVSGTVIELFAYDIIKIQIPDQMVDQLSTAPEEGPRLAAPAEAVPVQGPVLIAGQPATEPISPTVGSLQRGKVLYGINCQLCHGPEGKGNGPLSGFFNPKPFDLTSDAVRKLSDDEIFLIITQGRDPMPSLRENLSPEERWDVINYVRSLGK